MFYSKTLLEKKGPLGTVWIAGHLENKLRKNHVSGTDICSSVDCIIFSDVPMALRLSGCLLLGVVRIYSKKVEYLFQDSNHALKQMSTAFFFDDNQTSSAAPYYSITLPDNPNLDAVDEIPTGGSQKDEPAPSVAGLITYSTNENFAQEQSTQVLTETEVMRDSVNDFGLYAMNLDDNNTQQQQKHLDEEITNEKEPDATPMIDYASVPTQSPSEVATMALPDSTETYNSLGETSVPSALPVVEEKKESSRKRKILLDTTVMLNNDFMKEMLKDASDLVRKRRKLPCSALDVWKFNKRSKKEEVFVDPSISGDKGTNLNTTLQNNLFNKETVCPSLPETDRENIQDEFTPAAACKLVSDQETVVLLSQETTDYEYTQVLPSQETETTHLSDIPELSNSTEAEQLDFLETETYKENVEADVLMIRTRTVARYLKERSSGAGFSNEQVGNLSLGKILEGTTRRKCARMFYETLVLKCFDLIDVQQAAAYGDIALSLTS